MTAMEAGALRVLVAERKSRKGNANEDARYRRQENKNIRTAEASGHTVVAREADTVSSQTLPWQRRNLKRWFTDASRVAMWDAVLISEVARISRGNSDTWYEIEKWCRENGKHIMDGDGLLWPSADDKEWDNKRRAAREYWESVRDAHADVRADIMAAGAVIGRPPFGYAITEREDGYKAFVIDPVTGPMALEAFKRIASGRTATSVAEWLSEVAPIIRNGKRYPWRVKRVTDMIARRSYLGERDGHEYPSLLVSNADEKTAEEVAEEALALYNAANSAQARRSYSTSDKRRGVHAYSGVILCQCLAPLYRHQSTKNGKPVGTAHYRCARGRRGISGEARCSYGALGFDAANAVVDAYMLEDLSPERVMMTTGGNHGKLAELARIDSEMRLAMAKRDMAMVTNLAAKYAEAERVPCEPVRTECRKTGRTRAKCWESGSVAARRSILADLPVVVAVEAGEIIARYAADAE